VVVTTTTTCRYSPRMLSMVIMCLCRLFNFIFYMSSKLDVFVLSFEQELSGGLCCNGKGCQTGDHRLFQRFAANHTIPLYVYGGWRLLLLDLDHEDTPFTSETHVH
jgi:hypothetical protein